MKKRIIITLFILVFLGVFTSLASATNHCAIDQVILQLGSSTNAHAQLFNQGSYNVKICYDDIFGQNGNGNNICNGNNRVLRLSGVTNAHAEDPQGTNYAEEVCYGNLNCRLDTSCAANERVVVRLSSQTNAHLELASGTDYNYLICCSAPGIGPSQCSDGIDNDNDGLIDLADPDCDNNPGDNNEEPQCSDGIDNDNDGLIDLADPGCSDANDNDETNGGQPPGNARAYWADTSDSELPDRFRVGIGATVHLIAEGVPDSASVSFVVLDNDFPRPDQEIATFTTNAIGATAKYTWTIGPNDYNLGDDFLEIAPLELYFIASATPSYQEQSQTLLLGEEIVEPPSGDVGCKLYNDPAYVSTLPNNPSQEGACNSDLGNQLGNDPSYNLADSNFQDQFGIGCNEETIDSNGRTIKTVCSCKWENNECGFDSSHSISFPTGSPGEPICTPNCEYDYQEGTCINDEQTITLSRTFDNLQNCNVQQIAEADIECPEQSPIQLSCGPVSLLLPFFGISQFLISALVFLVIYMLIIVKRRKFDFHRS